MPTIAFFSTILPHPWRCDMGCLLWIQCISNVILNELTHWHRVTHICVSNLTIIGSDNGLWPGRRQAFVWTNDGILLIGPLGTNFSELFIIIQTFLFKKKHLKVSSAKSLPFCLGLNELIRIGCTNLCFFCYRWVSFISHLSCFKVSVGISFPA